MEEIIDKICTTIYEYYDELLKRYHKRVKFNGSKKNLYNLNDWICDIQAAVYDKDYEEEFSTIDINEILKRLGYNDIIIKFSKNDSLDFDDDYEEYAIYTSYKCREGAADETLAISGCPYDNAPDDVYFIIKTIVAYEFQKLIDARYDNDYKTAK